MDFEERRTKFHEEYKTLVNKYKVDFIALLEQSQQAIRAVIAVTDLMQKPQDKLNPSDKSLLN